MKRLLILSFALMCAICSGCGGDTHESLAAEGISVMKEMTTVLEGVKDEASARSAKPTLKSLMEKMNSISERQGKLKAPTEAEAKAMETKYGKDMEEVARKFQAQMLRVAFDPKIGAELQDIDMKKSMK